MDQMVLETQQWLNKTYGSDSRYENVAENGKTGWPTIYGLTRALQIELGIQKTADNFGPSTQKLFSQRWPSGIKQQDNSDTTQSNVYSIIQGALWCKGYSTGSHITQHFYDGTGAGIKALKSDMGIGGDPTVTVEIMKALLSMQQFVLLSSYGGKESLRNIQQEINREYKSYTGIIPTDGLYGREMNKAMIQVLQSLEGYTPSNATGNFGSGTKAKLKVITPSNASSNSKWVWLGRVMLLCNGYDILIHSGWDSDLEHFIQRFQDDYMLPEKNQLDTDTWMSLFVSKGNPERKADACDTRFEITDEFAHKLKSDGYKIIGRYLTGGSFKELRSGELQRIVANGFKYFPIFQDNGRTVDNFTYQTGKSNAQSASVAALNKGVPKGSVIYFAVDFDAYDYQVNSNILPYFKGVLDGLDMRYRVGIYASRNICSRICNAGYAVTCFVSDMSSGYSGNLGFSIPNNWNLDQFHEISGYGGKWDLDKVAYKGYLPVCKTVESNIPSYKPYSLPTIYSSAELSDIKPVKNVYGIIGDLEISYGEYKKSGYVHPEAVLYNNNVGTLQFLAGKYFHNPSAKGVLKNLGFSIVSNVQYDEMFELYLKHEKASLYNLASEYIAGNGTSLKDSLNGVIDLPHLAITTLSYYNKPINPPSWNGWAGDLVSAYSLVQKYHDSHSNELLPEIARAYIGGAHPEKDLTYAPDNSDNTCNFSDLCSDGYAILLAKEMAKHDSLADSFKTIFEAKAGKEFDAIRSDIGTENEIPNIRARVSEIVGGLVTNLLSTLENNFKDSDKDVKDACINTFAYWLHSKL